MSSSSSSQSAMFSKLIGPTIVFTERGGFPKCILHLSFAAGESESKWTDQPASLDPGLASTLAIIPAVRWRRPLLAPLDEADGDDRSMLDLDSALTTRLLVPGVLLGLNGGGPDGIRSWKGAPRGDALSLSGTAESGEEAFEFMRSAVDE